MTTTKSTPPYSALLPTILCQSPAVILHWLNEQRATGRLPVEIVLDVLIELVSRQTNPIESKSSRELINAHNAMYERLEVYKRVVKTLWPLALKHIDAISGLRAELEAVNQLESKERE